jgi:hypothetical protein
MPYPRSAIPKLGPKLARVRRDRMIAVGLPALVDAEPVRAHLQKLVDYGMNPMMIARCAGVTAPTVRNTLELRYKRLGFHTAALMMKAHPIPREDMSMVLSIGAVRRMRALQAIGWTGRCLEEAGGGMLGHLTSRKVCSYQKWAVIAQLYDQLSMTVGPSQQTRTWARNRGYPNPLEWEGLDIDDPEAQAVLAVELSAEFLAQERAELKAAVIEAYEVGISSASEIGQRFGVLERQVHRWTTHLRVKVG